MFNKNGKTPVENNNLSGGNEQRRNGQGNGQGQGMGRRKGKRLRKGRCGNGANKNVCNGTQRRKRLNVNV